MLSAAARPRWIVRVDARQRLQPLEQRDQRHDIRRERRQVEAPVLALLERCPDDEAHGDGGESMRQRRARGARGRVLGHRDAQRVRGLAGALALVALATEHANDPMAPDQLLEHVGHAAGARLNVARDAAQALAEVADREADDGQHDERQERQPPVEPQEPAEARGDRERRAHGRRDRARRGGGELVRVERDLRLHHAGCRLVVERRRQREQLVDQLAAQVEHDAVAGVRHAVFDTYEPMLRSERWRHGEGQ
jgi:hypothetical protein